MKHVTVDPDRCVGHGRCYSLAPDVYDCDDLGHSVVLVAQVSGELEQHALTGARDCPEDAITVT